MVRRWLGGMEHVALHQREKNFSCPHSFNDLIFNFTILMILIFVGRNVDVLARKHLWDRGLGYKHGTGHGIGSFLSIHEG